MPMMSVNQLASLAGMARATVSKRLEPLASQPGPKGALLYDSKLALPLLYQIGDGTSDRLDPQQEKAKLDRERRLVVELERQAKEGKLLDRDEVAETWAEVCEIAKGRWLAYPSRMAPEVAGLADQRKIEDRLRDGVYEILQEFIGDVLSRRAA